MQTYVRIFIIVNIFAISNANDIFVDDCPVGWVNAQSLGCFKFVQEARQTAWLDAQYFCEIEGGFLAEPSSSEQIDFLSGLAIIEQQFTGIKFWWIGLSDFGHESRWIWSNSIQEASEAFWMEGHPENSTRNREDCVFMELVEDKLEWRDGDCQMQEYEEQYTVAPLCQRHMKFATTSTTTSSVTTSLTKTSAVISTTSASGHCPMAWSEFGGSCFKVILDELDWVSARNNCLGEGGDLASVHSKEENLFIEALTNAALAVQQRIWIGGTDYISEGNWKWSDGSSFSYTNWYLNQGGSAENCIMFQENYGKEKFWYDESCFKKYFSVCKID